MRVSLNTASRGCDWKKELRKGVNVFSGSMKSRNFFTTYVSSAVATKQNRPVFLILTEYIENNSLNTRGSSRHVLLAMRCETSPSKFFPSCFYFTLHEAEAI